MSAPISFPNPDFDLDLNLDPACELSSEDAAMHLHEANVMLHVCQLVNAHEQNTEVKAAALRRLLEEIQYNLDEAGQYLPAIKK